MRKKFLIVILAISLLSCSPTPDQIQSAIELTQEALPTNTITNTDIPTETATVTYTPEPTSTPEPTNTPKPTNTPIPTATPTPLPEPIILTGETDSVVDLDKWRGPAIVRITYTGSGNFAIKNYGANNERYSLLVNTIGNFEGTVPIDFADSEQTVRFEVSARGPWEVNVLPLYEMRRESIPGTITGSGPDVVYLDGHSPDLLIVDGTNAKGNFVIWAYYGTRRRLVVNEIAPYSGTVLLDRETLILEIKEGGGEWSLEITTN